MDPPNSEPAPSSDSPEEPVNNEAKVTELENKGVKKKSVDDFIFGEVLGEGAYGAVRLLHFTYLLAVALYGYGCHCCQLFPDSDYPFSLFIFF
jgi:hypothetical protein